MPSFENALSSDLPRLAAVRALIANLKERGPGRLGKVHLAGVSLEAETGLRADCWEAIADRYIAHGLTDLEASLTAIFRTCQLAGDEDHDRRRGYGRAVKHAELVEMWSTTWPKTEVERIVRNLPFQSADAARSTVSALALGRYIMWSTYCERHYDCDPFDPRSPKERLIDDLGLIFSIGDVFYLFWYNIPASVPLHVPTVADAYSGGYFFPFKPGGRTFPRIHPDELTGRPERVHKPINGDNLLSAVEAIILTAM
jgi:hypothetical protein